VIDIKDIQAAQVRISNYIRHTPLVEAKPIKQPVCQAQALYLKLECMQIGGSFKARGAVNKLLSLPPQQLQHGLVTASGGNHGLGVAYAGWLAHVPVTIYLPQSTPLVKAHKLESWGAKVIFKGTVWDEANKEPLAWKFWKRHQVSICCWSLSEAVA
jgi:threonine dehydratase